MTITSITPSPAVYTQTNTCGTTLAGGAECSISVVFTPTATGSAPGTLKILQGGLTTTVTLAGTGAAQAFLTLSSTSLNFGDQSVDFASPFQTVSVGNSATTSLTLSSPPFSFSSSPGNAFAQTNNCPASLATNKTCSVNIAFLPTQNGPFTGTMFVSSGNNGNPISSVSLTGNGIVGTPTLTLSSAGLVFNPQDVGTISIGQSVTVTNTGNVPVTIFASSFSGTGSTDYTLSGCIQTLNPGGECFVRVTFVPTTSGTRGPATVTLMDSTTVGIHTFTVTGTGVNPTLTLAFDPPALTFANLAVGATSTPALTVQVTNTGTAAVPIDRVFTTGDFRVSSPGCVPSLRVGSTPCSVGVEFTPTAVGTRTGTLVFEDAATGSPQSVPLSGTAIATVAAAVASPNSIDFGTQAVGTPTLTALTVTLDNIGNLPFDASNVTITGTNSGDFQIYSQGCLDDLLTPDRTCTEYLTFTPTATGPRAGMLTFTNAAGTQTATLAGNGVTATSTLVLIPTTLTFQQQQENVSSPSQTVLLINTGSAPVTPTSIVSGSTDYTTSECVGSPIPPNSANSACAVTVTFKPSVTGADNSSLTIKSTASSTGQAVALNGTGASASVAMQFATPGGNLTFNSQVVGTTSTGQFVELLNTSSSTVTGITLASTDASEFTLSNDSGCTTLTAGTACDFEVTFKPSATGARSGSVTVTYTGTAGSPQTLAVAGFGVAATTGAILQTKNLFFPNETASSTKAFVSPSQYATFQNTGNTPITISSVALAGTDPGDFTISSEGCPTTTPFLAFASCNVYVQFNPTVVGTNLTATLEITYTVSGGSPTVADVTLTGTGVAASQGLVVDPANINFPPTVEGTSSSLSPSVLLTNTGTSPVTITSVVLTLGTGTVTGDFTITNECPASLQQGPIGNTCSIPVAFAPSVATATARSAKITITNSATTNPIVINLSGTGVAETKLVSVTPTTLVFDPQTTGTSSAPQTITVTNTGNFTVTFTGSDATVTADYAFASGQQGCTGTLPPGQSCEIGVIFTAPSGLTATKPITGTLTITDNSTVAIGTKTAGTQIVTLSATGIPTASDILLSQLNVVFDAQTVGTTSSPQVVYYYNQGNASSTISSVALGGTDPGDFVLSTSGCPTVGSVGALSFCTISLTFKPTAAGPRGPATVTIKDSGSHTITLNGTGVSTSVPEVNFLPASLTFAAQADGTTSAAQNINLTNNGLGNLTGLTIGLGGATPGAFGQTNNCPTILAAGFSCNISVTFSPTTEVGPVSATVTATDNATGSPQSVALNGTGKSGPLPR